jgi:hypothetical protein
MQLVEGQEKILNKKKAIIRYNKYSEGDNLANSSRASRILFAGGQGNAGLGNARRIILANNIQKLSIFFSFWFWSL